VVVVTVSFVFSFFSPSAVVTAFSSAIVGDFLFSKTRVWTWEWKRVELDRGEEWNGWSEIWDGSRRFGHARARDQFDEIRSGWKWDMKWCSQ
jgi:hypothetical protein